MSRSQELNQSEHCMAGDPACLVIVRTVKCMCTSSFPHLSVCPRHHQHHHKLFVVLSSSHLFGKFVSFFFVLLFFLFCCFVSGVMLHFHGIQFSFGFIWLNIYIFDYYWFVSVVWCLIFFLFEWLRWFDMYI